MEISKDEALMIYNSGIWRKWSEEERFLFQVQQPKLCMDFSAFQAATEKALRRPVYTHEFANPNALLDEYTGRIPKASLADIMAKVPKETKIMTILLGGKE